MVGMALSHVWVVRMNSPHCNQINVTFYPTVDGRDPAPVDRWFIPLFLGFQWVSTTQSAAGFLPSTVSLILLGVDDAHHSIITSIAVVNPLPWEKIIGPDNPT